MKQERVRELRGYYRCCLIDDVLPFWLRHSVDYECGGYFNCLARDGSVYSTDKSIILQGRATWLFAKLYNTLEPRQDWLDTAKLGYDFLMKYGFDSDGRMFSAVTRDGQPLEKCRIPFAETFGAIACAEYAKATNDERALERAKVTYRLLIDLYQTPRPLPPWWVEAFKIYPKTRLTKSLIAPLLLLTATRELRELDSDPLYAKVIDTALDQILDQLMKLDEHALHETVSSSGARLDSPEGRCLNPGHGIETSWFILQEGCYRNDVGLKQSALDILSWSLEWGWDKKYGGILYFVDVEGKPLVQPEWDMKLWWVHNEALYATLLAHHLTGKTEYLDWYERIHKWTFEHFPDSKYGEWYGYLHRDGTLSLPFKGSMWKGAFHVPRCLWQCQELLKNMAEQV